MPEEVEEEPALPWEQQIEAGIVARLTTALAPLPVEPLPDKTWRFVHPKGAALVVLSGIDPDESVDLYAVAQPVLLTYDIVLLSRSLRDGTGLYALLAATRKALLGWVPLPGLTPLKFGKVRNEGQDEGAWRISTSVKTQGLWVDDAEPEIGPLLNQLTFEEV